MHNSSIDLQLVDSSLNWRFLNNGPYFLPLKYTLKWLNQNFVSLLNSTFGDILSPCCVAASAMNEKQGLPPSPSVENPGRVLYNIRLQKVVLDLMELFTRCSQDTVLQLVKASLLHDIQTTPEIMNAIDSISSLLHRLKEGDDS